jgi:hypothetical protein
MTTELTSYGDCLEPGIYGLHSRFRNSINYVMGSRLVTLVSGKAGSGPFHIVVSGLSRCSSRSLLVTPGFVHAGEVRLMLPAEKKYHSVPSPRGLNLQPARVLLERLQSLVARYAHDRSLAFLIDGGRRKRFRTSFERSFYERAVVGWGLFLDGRLIEAVHLLRGMGFGFTPSGDDFIAGVASGLYVMHRHWRLELCGQLRSVRDNRDRGNVVSENFVAFAAEGRFMENIKLLIESFLTGGGERFSERVRRVMDSGETSGADFLTGLICSFKMHGLG